MLRKERKHIFITCSPKSGSSYLLRLLASVLGYEIKIFIAAFDRTGQDVHEPAILEVKNKNTVTHQHTRFTNHNMRILNEYAIKPVVLTRDIFASVISMRNHMINEPDQSWWPMAYIDQNFYELSTEEQYDFVIDLIVPWYINFYVSWFRHPKREKLLWIDYDELMKDKVGTLRKIFEYYGIEQYIDDAILREHEKKIEGKTRRTKQTDPKERLALSSEQRSRIVDLTRYYRDVDFAKMNIR